MLQQKQIFEIIKTDFCNLFNFRQRGDTLEVITSISTVTNCHVSVFISYKQGKYIVSDGAWISKEMYDNQIADESLSKELISKLIEQYVELYQIKIVVAPDKNKYYYKITEREDMISALVFEVANFAASVVNTQSLFYVEEKEEAESHAFRKEVNDFLKITYSDSIKFQTNLKNHLSSTSNLKFHAIFGSGKDIGLAMYVSGSTPANFTSSSCKAIANFEIITRNLPDASYFKKITIVNNHSQGYDVVKSEEYLQHLQEITNIKPVSFYGFRNDILRYIPK